jgi:hypothetical protein
MGIYLLMHFLGSIYSAVWRWYLECPPVKPEWEIPVITFGLAFTLAGSWILLFRSDWLARMVTGPDTGLCKKADIRWITGGLRITACFCGLLIIYTRIGYLFYYVPIFMKSPILSYMTLEGQSSLLSAKTLTGILVETIKWIVAIYLIFGAPHYVRRQVRAITAKNEVKNE